MKKNMFINAQRTECRIAIVTDGALSELYTERSSRVSQVGNIYKGRVTNVEPSIQAAFVDFGKAKNGFLHISDLRPRYFPEGMNKTEDVGSKRARKDRPPIQACIKKGQEVVVQVTKEGIGTKGATLTTYLSIPGRYLVLMPGMHRLGVSRKIEDEATRAQMRAILEDLQPPPDMGFILRTAGMGRPKRELQRDLSYLLRLWKAVEQRSKEARAPAELYQESDLVIRTIRDVYNTEVERIICDDEVVACKVWEFLKLTMPRTGNRVELYTGNLGLFDAFGLERELESITSPVVPLPSGGSLVIEQAEALVAIDVNSGRFRDTESTEQTALRTNTEAAPEVVRQLRLRDLGGVIIIDFIDMMQEKNRRRIENILREELKEDRARSKILRMSRFGIVEMTRQRVRPSLVSSTFQSCPHCGGTGHVKSDESQSLSVMRTLRLAANDERVSRIELTVSQTVADHILNDRRDELSELAQSCQTAIRVRGGASLAAGEFRLVCSDARGLPIEWDSAADQEARPKQAPTREITKADVSDFRRRQRAASAQAPPAPPAPAAEPKPAAPEPAEKKPHRRRRRGRKKASPQETEAKQAQAGDTAEPQPSQPPPPATAKPTAKRRRRRRKRTTP